MGSNYRNVKDSVSELQRTGKISNESAKALQQNSHRNIQVPDLQNTFQDPVFACFLIDASGSMDVCRQAVIDSHPVMLDALRGSAKCRHGALFVAQYLFNVSCKPLHSFVPLAQQSGADQVVVLDKGAYGPSGGTALYKTVYLLLQDMAVMMEACAQSGLSPQFTIGLITDGQDTEGGVNTDSIKRFLDELRKSNTLRSAVIIGLVSQQFQKAQLEQIRSTLGFDKAESCGQSSAREIRRAFVLASQSAIGS